MRVLVVDDNEDDRFLIRHHLGRSLVKAEVMECGTLSEAFEVLDSVGADCVLLDLSLPDSSAEETFSRLHARFPEVPVVITTGYDDGRLAIRLLERGARGFILKRDLSPAVVSAALSPPARTPVPSGLPEPSGRPLLERLRLLLRRLL